VQDNSQQQKSDQIKILHRKSRPGQGDEGTSILKTVNPLLCCLGIGKLLSKAVMYVPYVPYFSCTCIGCWWKGIPQKVGSILCSHQLSVGPIIPRVAWMYNLNRRCVCVRVLSSSVLHIVSHCSTVPTSRMPQVRHPNNRLWLQGDPPVKQTTGACFRATSAP
jgi:hypothetical protein